MKIFKTKLELSNYLKSRAGDCVGFVPTMGALHQGHLKLVKRSILENHLTVCSIFVNPTQFNKEEDLINYPKTLEQDIQFLQDTGCDVLFLPSTHEVYTSKSVIKFDFGQIERVLEGEFRPGHFNGVGLVVSKLFHFVSPDRAYFGQKDYQQFAIIQQLVEDLSFPVKLVCVDTEREEDGLAMSSRNLRLSSHQREIAPLIYKQLLIAKNSLISGRSVTSVRESVISTFETETNFDLEYFEVVHPKTLQKVDDLDAGAVLCIAAYLGGIRLIDNIVIKKPE